MSLPSRLPLFNHEYNSPSAFTPEALMVSVRTLRNQPAVAAPAICVLEFDGDLTDWLIARGLAKRFDPWPCFHTSMFTVDFDGIQVGIVARTIGGPYTVLIAEQLHAAGTRFIVGLTSAGRVASDLPLPCLVVATSAVRDEGTSCHYLPPASDVECPTPAHLQLESELCSTGWAVRSGRVWTTDAPYRETEADLRKWAAEGVLAVEMQAASLFAFGKASGANVAVVAMVSNAVDHQGDQFNTGTQDDGMRILRAIARAAHSFLKADRLTK